MNAGCLALVHFDTPGYLALLAILPLLVVLSIRSMAGLGLGRAILATLARCAVVTLVVLALAGAHRVKLSDELTVEFVVDRSNSVPIDLQQRAFAYLADAATACGQKDRIAVIGFDGTATVEQPPMKALAIERISEPLEPNRTDLAEALRLGMALFPPDAARRLVVLSDGNENAGDVLAEAEHFKAAGVPIDVVPLLYQHQNEVVLERLRTPPTAATDETIQAQVVLRSLSETPVSGRVLLYQQDRLLDLDPGTGAGYPVTLQPGPNRFSIPIPLYAAATHRFRAVFEPDDPAYDAISNNNEGRAFTVVSGQGRILILTTEEDLASDAPSAPILRDALLRDQLICDLRIAGETPLDQTTLLDYAAVILSNVPAGNLRVEEQQALTVYVRNLGGGLIMLGGPDSFGAGGWISSPIEEIMPVTFEVKNKRQIPNGALVLVMHASEMAQGNFWGERVAIAAVKALSSQDLVGVLSWNWQGQGGDYWDVPLQHVGNKTSIIQAIMKMEMGDMPDLDEVMRPGVEALMAEPNIAVRHMIVISDWDPQPPKLDLIQTMKDNKVSCSTVAIGFGAGGHGIDEQTPQWIAAHTGGRYYRTNDPRNLPKVFIKESRTVRRRLVHEVSFLPSLVNTLPQTVAGLSAAAIPQLDGYVVTTPKPLADVPLVRRTEEATDPILAHWKVGLGKTVAFTSGHWPHWGSAWVNWTQFSPFWAQVVRWASRRMESAALDVRTSVEGGRGRIRVEALDAGAEAIDFLTIEGVLVTPAQETRPLRLTQTGPGRYEAEFDAADRGNYVIQLEYDQAGAPSERGLLRTGVSVAYSPEYREMRSNPALLEQLAAQTGGRVLGAGNAAAVFDRASLPRPAATLPIWEDLIRWMLLLFLLDVAIRRIALRPKDAARKARQMVAEMGGARAGGESEAVLSTLKGTRKRVRDEARRPADAPSVDRGKKYDAKQADRRATDQLSKTLGGAGEQDAPVVARPTGKKPKTDEADYTSRLLRAKRRARGQSDSQKNDDSKTPGEGS